MYFKSAYHVLMRMREIYFLYLEDMIGYSLMHEAIALKYCGKSDDAKQKLSDALDVDFLPLMARKRIVDELDKLVRVDQEENVTGRRTRFDIDFDIYELFESLVDTSDYTNAEVVVKTMDIYFSKNNLNIDSIYNHINTLSETMDAAQTNKFGKHLYFRAMLLLNHAGDYSAAATHFELAGNILKKLKENGADVETNFIGLAYLHQAIALKYSGDKIQAASVVHRALKRYYLRDDERNRLRSLKEQLS